MTKLSMKKLSEKLGKLEKQIKRLEEIKELDDKILSSILIKLGIKREQAEAQPDKVYMAGYWWEKDKYHGLTTEIGCATIKIRLLLDHYDSALAKEHWTFQINDGIRSGNFSTKERAAEIAVASVVGDKERIPENCAECDKNLCKDKGINYYIRKKIKPDWCPYNKKKQIPEGCHNCEHKVEDITALGGHKCPFMPYNILGARIIKERHIACPYNKKEKPLIPYKREINIYDQDDIPDDNREVETRILKSKFARKGRYNYGCWYFYIGDEWVLVKKNIKFYWHELFFKGGE